MARKDPLEGIRAFAEPDESGAEGPPAPGGLIAGTGQKGRGSFPGREQLKMMEKLSKSTSRLIREVGRLEARQERLFSKSRRGYSRRKKETDDWREAVGKLISQGLRVIPSLLDRQAEGWFKVGKGMGGMGGEIPRLIQGFSQLDASSQGFLASSISGFEQHRALLKGFGGDLGGVSTSFLGLLDASTQAGAGLSVFGESLLQTASSLYFLREQLLATGGGLSIMDYLKGSPIQIKGGGGGVGLATLRSITEFAQSTEGTMGSVGAGVGAFLSGGNPAVMEFGARAGRLVGNVVKPITQPIVKFFKKIFDEGGMIDFDAGLAFPGQRVLINAQVGEAVLSRRAVAALGGPSAVERLNRGAWALPVSKRGDTAIHLGPINISGADLSTREHRREVARRLARDIRSELMELERFTFRA